MHFEADLNLGSLLIYPQAGLISGEQTTPEVIWRKKDVCIDDSNSLVRGPDTL